MGFLRCHIAWIALAAAGCGAATPEAREPRAKDDLDALRAERLRDKRRLADLENELLVMRDKIGSASATTSRTPAASPSNPSSPGSAATLVPSLPVEVVGPGEGPPSADIDPELAALGEHATVVGTTHDGTEIVYVGDAALGKSGTLSGDSLEPEPLDRLRAGTWSSSSRSTPTRAASLPRAARAPRATARSAGDPVEPRYREALDHLRRHEHETAIAMFRALVTEHGEHELADNALYWLGEAYYDQKLFELAIIEFRRAVTEYPAGNKAPDAMLKLGYSHLALGAVDDGRRTLEQLISAYPRSNPALIAAQRLETMETP